MSPAAGLGYHPKGYAQYTVLSAAVKLTDAPSSGVALPDGAVFAIITPELQKVRWRDEGIPTSAIGNPLAVDIPYEYDGDLAKIQFIEAAGGAKLNVVYYGI